MSEHIVPPKVYIGIFLSLMVLTAVTVAAAFVSLGPLNIVIALAIATLKATLVVLYSCTPGTAPSAPSWSSS